MFTLQELATLVNGELVGDPRLEIGGVSEIQNGRPGTITFFANPRYRQYLAATGASAIITSQRADLAEHNGIVVANPARALALILEKFAPPPEIPDGIHPAALVDPTAKLDPTASVGPFTVIEGGVTIESGTSVGAHCIVGRDVHLGPDCRLYPGVTIYRGCHLGARVIVHSGTVIGADGFGFVTMDDQHRKIPQNGSVEIGDDVEIGANCTIDRGTIASTTIGAGSKLDDQVHLAHNVQIGRGCLLAGQVGIAGSSRLGDFCILAGQVGVASHVTIGDRAICAARTGVTKSIPGGKTYAGMPVHEIREQNRRDAVMTEVAILKKRLLKLERQAAATPTQDE